MMDANEIAGLAVLILFACALLGAVLDDSEI